MYPLKGIFFLQEYKNNNNMHPSPGTEEKVDRNINNTCSGELLGSEWWIEAQISSWNEKMVQNVMQIVLVVEKFRKTHILKGAKWTFRTRYSRVFSSFTVSLNSTEKMS